MLSTYFDEARKILLGLLSWENRTMSESFESRFVLHEGTLSERTKNMDELLETLLAVIKEKGFFRKKKFQLMEFF
ncbi:Oidioi.mRNA.OKI2018_I69.PAR.g11689.t1.cds [Oikopleura dioica]|uniref:Oidioi.mRNA.OKI2018_I69.PAR.g11689.t1.cds n=1 Tax=Oikopleura dioica TaxID=34765 RepID=A0ABN7RZU1_OIKDI|nr:Oidioi.mRNA.OKI2018_I69.PAR.g11689.t1.cds [Oikopleura dioica]